MVYYYVKIRFRQRDPSGQDLPPSRCETTENGPFTERKAAEQFAASVANTTPVFHVQIEEVPANGAKEDPHGREERQGLHPR